MASLTARHIVQLWESGSRQHPVDRALTMLAHACPEFGREELAGLTIGERDALLFALREETFGRTMDAFVECPRCGERLEFSLPTTEFSSLPASATAPGAGLSWSGEGVQVTFRLPDSRDLAAAAGCGDLAAGRSLLLQRCIVEATMEGGTVFPADLPEEAIAGVAGRMAACDPAGDILLNLECPACRSGWQQPFDIASFLWAELAREAKRLLLEVHTLARAYGWGEGEILAMGAARRASYLEMIHG